VVGIGVASRETTAGDCALRLEEPGLWRVPFVAEWSWTPGDRLSGWLAFSAPPRPSPSPVWPSRLSGDPLRRPCGRGRDPRSVEYREAHLSPGIDGSIRSRTCPSPPSTCSRASTPADGAVPKNSPPASVRGDQPRTCSVLVVLHHLDGLLRSRPGRPSASCRYDQTRSCRLIASCCRSWGSLRFVIAAFRRPGSWFPRPDRGRTTCPRSAVHTLRRSPPDISRFASPRPLPPCRSPPSRGASTSRLCSVVGSVTHRRVSAAGRALLPWASFPFEIRSSPANFGFARPARVASYARAVPWPIGDPIGDPRAVPWRPRGHSLGSRRIFAPP